MFRKLKVITAFSMAFLLVVSATAVYAAPFAFTVTAQKAFDKMVAETTTKAGSALKKDYDELQKLQHQEIDWDKRISALHYKNEENDGLLRKRIKEIDKAKISSLEAGIEKTEQHYEPLFELYDSQRSQLSLARASKNKDLIAFANAQVEVTKIAVQAANKDIDAKEDQLAKAKSDASAKMKEIREMLGGNDATESRIKAVKSSISASKKLFSSETSKLVRHVRNGEELNAALSLTRLLIYERQILTHKTNIHYYEQQIAAVIAKAEAKLKGYQK